jgi:capsular exopolysaccharide synthesis family protein
MELMGRLFEFIHNLTGKADESISPSGSGEDSSAAVARANRMLGLRQTGVLVGGRKIEDDSAVRVDGVNICPTERLALYSHPTSFTADRYRLLRMRLLELRTTGKLRSVVVTSPLPGDGKSTIALNLAAALAEQQKQTVLLIDGDLHRPSLSTQLGINPHVGLTECLQSGLDPLSVTQQIEPFAWHFLSAGKRVANDPTALLHTQILAEVIHKVSAYFDWTVIDSPPLLPLTDAISLAHLTDGSLLVARAGRTPGASVEEAISLLSRKRVIGVILNGLDALDGPCSAYYRNRRVVPPV